MTTAIRYIEDLFRVLDDDPEQLEELRRRVLGPALLNLPERFDRFVTEQTASTTTSGGSTTTSGGSTTTSGGSTTRCASSIPSSSGSTLGWTVSS